MNFFANQNEPVRLFYDMPDYNINRGVQAEIYDEGTVDDGSKLIKTVDLDINSSITGRYEAFYTPTTTKPRLTVRFVIYTNTSFTTKFIGIAPFSAQINMNAGLGGGFGATGDIKFDLTDTEANKFAEAVWKTKLETITEEDSASVWLKTRSDLTTKEILSIIKGFFGEKLMNLKKLIVNSDNKIKGIESTLNDVGKKIDDNKKVITDRIEEVVNRMEGVINKVEVGSLDIVKKINDNLEKLSSFENKIDIKASKDNLLSHIHLFQLVTVFDKKIEGFILNQKIPKMNDFSGFLEGIESKNKALNLEQSEFITNFLKSKIQKMVTEMEIEVTKKVISNLGDTINRNGSSGFTESQGIKTMIANLQKTVDEKGKISKQRDDRSKKDINSIILTIQDNAGALGKLIQSKDIKKMLEELINEINNLRDNG